MPNPARPASNAPLKHSTIRLFWVPIIRLGKWKLGSTNPLAKRPRFENIAYLSTVARSQERKIVPTICKQEPVNLVRGCKFDHPIWVPDGGIPDWKEVPLVAPSESLPERPGAPDCPYFLKTQRCKFGLRCKFNHPKDKLATACASENGDVYALPETPRGLLNLHFYLKTGQCKYGATCKFNHPKDMIPSATQENKSGETETDLKTEGSEVAVKPLVGVGITANTQITLELSKHDAPLIWRSAIVEGLPASWAEERLARGSAASWAEESLAVLTGGEESSEEAGCPEGEADCPFYLKTGSCKYGATCQYNHPDRYDINPPVAAISYPLSAPSVAGFNMGVANPAAFTNQTLAQPTLGASPTVYPQRFGQAECEYYMKTGECKYGAQCRFHHPIDRPAVALSTTKPSQQENVKLTLAGLPRREGAVIRVYYLKTGTCKYGATCRFDHPPPGEVVAMAASQAKSDSIGGKA
ncbi:putative transcription factor C3H family [Rosa chinensis]|uniref:Putative transcription factor C3H family n=1 Tax=Rosa chinensis TaxID=74649 RepID=A0A2P6Q7W8_ROSCH|nr:putative transcription factor C3H family [Rosa chinensis]